MLGYNEAMEEIEAILAKKNELDGQFDKVKTSLNATVSHVGEIDIDDEALFATSGQVIKFRLPDGEIIEKRYTDFHGARDDDMPEWEKLMNELGSDPVNKKVRLDFTGSQDGLVISGINVENHRPAAMEAIKVALQAEIRKSEGGMEKRWWPEVSDEVKQLMPTILAAPEMLEVLEYVHDLMEHGYFHVKRPPYETLVAIHDRITELIQRVKCPKESEGGD